MSNYDIATVVAERDRLKYELSQAQETIADFRSALEEWMNTKTYEQRFSARENTLKALQKHADSTEVK